MIQEKKTITAGPHILKFNVTDIPNIFFTSDLHFNHANIIKYSNRPFKDVDEMNNTLFTNLNNELSTVEHPILINCGDFMFGSLSTYDEFMNNIKADKIYNIIGNHDVKNIIQRRQLLPYNENEHIFWSTELIVQIYNENNKLLTQFTVSHYPHCDCQFHGVFNIHGHLHTPANIDDYTGVDINIAKKLIEKKFTYDVGVDKNNYKPVKLINILTGNLPTYQLNNINFDNWKKNLNFLNNTPRN